MHFRFTCSNHDFNWCLWHICFLWQGILNYSFRYPRKHTSRAYDFWNWSLNIVKNCSLPYLRTKMFQLFFTLAKAYIGRLPLHYGCAMEENICQVVQYILWNNIWRHDRISMLVIEKSTTYNRSSVYGTTIKKENRGQIPRWPDNDYHRKKKVVFC